MSMFLASPGIRSGILSPFPCRSVLAAAVAALLVGLLAGCGGDGERRKVVEELTPDLASHLRVADLFCPGRPGCRDLMRQGWGEPRSGRDSLGVAPMSAAEAVFLLPVSTPGSGTLEVTAWLPGARRERSARALEVVVGDRAIGRSPLSGDADHHRFAIPAGTFGEGVNEIRLRVVPAPTDGDGSWTLPVVRAVRFLPAAGGGPDETDEPSWPTRPLLDRRTFLTFPVPDLDGSRLVLAWDDAGAGPRDQLVVRILPRRPHASPVWEKRLAARGASRCEIHFGKGLPSSAAMTVSLEGKDDRPAEGSLSIAEARLLWRFRPHNVVLIVVDTMRPDFLGCYGDPHSLTPRMDELAADGILFETALTHIPITGPSHAALFSARYPLETGILNNSGAAVRDDQAWLPEILRMHGYDTGAAVSLPPLRSQLGFDRGFDAYDDRFGLEIMITADTLLRRAVNVLDGLGELLFLFAHFCDPHEPYNAHGLVQREAEVLLDGEQVLTVPTSDHEVRTVPVVLPPREVEILIRSEHAFSLRKLGLRAARGERPRLIQEDEFGGKTRRYRAIIGASGTRDVQLFAGLSDVIEDRDEMRERYAREVAYVDERVGALLDTLRARDLYDESLVILTADHGEALGEHGGIGHVNALWDTNMRIPLILKPPASRGLGPAMRRTDIAALTDLVPTILGLLDVPRPEGCRGRDLLAKGAATVRRDVLLETHAPQAIHDLFGMRDDRMKLIMRPEDGRLMLFDLSHDPGEDDDLSMRLVQLRDRRSAVLADTLGAVTAPDSAGRLEIPLDEETRRNLRALGY